MKPPEEAVRLVRKAEEMLREADSLVWRDQPGRATGLSRTVKTLETWLKRSGQ